MGTTQHVVETYFYVHDDRDAFPDDQRAVDDFHGAVAALLADPRYEDLAISGTDPTAAVAALDWESRVRIIQLLTGALTRVRTVTEQQAKSIPDDYLRRL